MSKTSTSAALVALTLGTTCLQSTFVNAGATLTSVTTSQMATAMSAPAQQSTTITQASSPTVSNNGNSTQTGSAMNGSWNTGGDVPGKSKYLVVMHNKHMDAAAGGKIRSNVAALGALHNPAAKPGGAPKGKAGSIYGNGKNKGAKGVPGLDNIGNGPSVNLPGASNSKGPKSVPGFENVGDGPSLNLPGSRQKNTPADAAKALAALESADVSALLDKAAQGPSVNVPTQSSAPQEQADGLLNSIFNFFGGGSSDSAAKTSPSAKSGETSAPANTTNANGESQGQSKATKEQHTVVDSEDIGSAYKDAAGNPYVTNGYIMHDVMSGKAIGGSMVTVGPITVIKSRQMPSDDSSGPVNAQDGLAIDNPYTAHDNGGGTGNNIEQASAGSTDMAANSSYAQKENGDGSNDAGENGLTASDTLTSNSLLARKDQGDGGNADGRGTAAAQAKN